MFRATVDRHDKTTMLIHGEGELSILVWSESEIITKKLAAQINAGAGAVEFNAAAIREAVRMERERVRLAMEAYYHPQRIPSWLSEILDHTKGGAE